MSFRQTAVAPAIGAVLMIAAGLRAAGPVAERVVPSAEIVQVLLAGKGGVPRDFNPTSLAAIGDYLYTGSPQGNGTIQYFNRDAKAGTITCAGSVPPLEKKPAVEVHVAGGRLYAFAREYTNNKIVCFDIDAQSGKPTEKASMELTRKDGGGKDVKVAWVGTAVGSLDGKNLYVTADNVIFWFKIEADGTLVKSGELAGKGVGMFLAIAPDGKYLYSLSNEPVPAIACIECKPTGELVVKDVTPLNPKWKAPRGETFPSMSFAPDGKGLYVGYWNRTGWDNLDRNDKYLAIFRRAPDSGQLTLQAAGCGNDTTQPDFKLANSAALNLVFLPDGLSGFVCSGSGGLLRSFRRDAATGRLDSIADLPEWDLRKLATGHVVFDAKHNQLIGVSANNFYLITHALWVAKIGTTPAQPYSSIKTAVIGTGAAVAPTTAADWPCWRGPTHDLRSPLKGIRKDWAGGLKKAWEVEGLSPGTDTWSMPSISGDKLVITGRHGWVDEVFCFDADKGGSPLWVAEIEGGDAGHFDWGSGPHASPAISGDKVYVANLAGIGACLSLADGHVLWQRYIGNIIYTCSPLVIGDLVVFSGGYHGDKELTACRKDTGEVAWTAGKGSITHSSPAPVTLGGTAQILQLDHNRIFSVDPLTGQQLWEYSDKKMTGAGDFYPRVTPVVDGDIVYIGWVGPTLQIADGVPKVLWAEFSGAKEKFERGSLFSDPIIIDGYLYHFEAGGAGWLAGANGWLACSELKTGQVKWMENIGRGSMVCVDGCLLCLTYAGDLVLVEPHPEGFKKLAEVKGLLTPEPWPGAKAAKLNDPLGKADPHDLAPCWVAPAVARGKVYLRYGNRLVCYDLMK